MRNKLLLTALALFGWIASLDAQDVQFTQMYVAPTWVNPALSGSYNGSFRVFSQYRNQWGNTLERPIGDFLIGGDVAFDIPKSRRQRPDKASGSLILISDRYGSFDFSTTGIFLSGAFHKSMSQTKSSYLSAGAQISMNQRSFVNSDLLFEDQFNGIDAFDQGTSEILPNNTLSFFDVNVGLNYSLTSGRLELFQIGISTQHVLRSNISYYQDFEDPQMLIETDKPLLNRFTLNTSLDYEINDDLRIIPKVLFTLQDPYTLAQANTTFRLVMGAQRRQAIHMGAGVRVVDGIGDFSLTEAQILTGYELDGLQIGFSYDFNVNSFAVANQIPGTFEISISFVGNHANGDLFCPQF